MSKPDWEYNSHTLAFTLRHPEADERLHVMLNAYWEPLAFELPLLGHGDRWHRIIDTALKSPEDYCEPKTAPPYQGEQYLVQARSSAILMVKVTDSDKH